MKWGCYFFSHSTQKALLFEVLTVSVGLCICLNCRLMQLKTTTIMSFYTAMSVVKQLIERMLHSLHQLDTEEFSLKRTIINQRIFIHTNCYMVNKRHTTSTLWVSCSIIILSILLLDKLNFHDLLIKYYISICLQLKGRQRING